jgi:hypothetical protein
LQKCTCYFSLVDTSLYKSVMKVMNGAEAGVCVCAHVCVCMHACSMFIDEAHKHNVKNVQA